MEIINGMWPGAQTACLATFYGTTEMGSTAIHFGDEVIHWLLLSLAW